MVIPIGRSECLFYNEAIRKNKTFWIAGISHPSEKSIFPFFSLRNRKKPAAAAKYSGEKKAAWSGCFFSVFMRKNHKLKKMKKAALAAYRFFFGVSMRPSSLALETMAMQRNAHAMGK